MPHGCVIARFSRVRPTRRCRRSLQPPWLLRDLQVAKVRPYCDNNGELGEWGHCGKRGRRSSTRFISYGWSYVYERNAMWSGPYQRFDRSLLRFRTFRPFDPSSPHALALSGSFLSSRFFRSRYIRYLVPDFLYSPQFPPLYFFRSVSTVSRDIFFARHVKGVDIECRVLVR